MNKLYELLLMRKREFDYSILFASILILCSSIVFRHKSNLVEAMIEILSPVLLGLCALGIWAWYRSTRYAYFTKKIRRRYVQTLYKQEHKLRRLTSLELRVLNGLLDLVPAKQIAMEQRLPVAEIYRCIDVLIIKLDIQQEDLLRDLDWKNAIGQ